MKRALVIGSEGNIGITCEQASGLTMITNLARVNNVLQLCKRAKTRAPEMIRRELGASRDFNQKVSCPRQTTPIKRPALTRQQDILGIASVVSLGQGVPRACQRVREKLRAIEVV